MSDSLQQAITALKSGDRKTGGQLLKEILKSDPSNELAWLWMTKALAKPEQQRQCLQRVLEINPDNATTKQALALLEKKLARKSSAKSRLETFI